MNQYIAAAVGLLATYIVYSSVSSFISNRRYARQARKLGCLPPFRRTHKYPLAFDLMQEVIQADRSNTVPTHFLEVYHSLGNVATWVQNVFGSTAYFTSDPKNIQAVLATQFRDFEIGPQRRGGFFPLLGNGIFTSDGKAWYVETLTIQSRYMY